jgi:hypothetical protein
MHNIIREFHSVMWETSKVCFEDHPFSNRFKTLLAIGFYPWVVGGTLIAVGVVKRAKEK